MSHKKHIRNCFRYKEKFQDLEVQNIESTLALKKLIELNLDYISIFKPEVRPALWPEHNGVNMNETY